MRHGIDVTVTTLDEGTTPELTATLVDLAQVPVPGSALDTLALTYYQEYTLAIINSRDMQDVLQTNGVTVDEDGVLLWKMTVLDTVILNDALETEPHIAHFAFSYTDAGDTKVGSMTIRIPIANILRD